jgi:hypothetical protein
MGAAPELMGAAPELVGAVPELVGAVYLATLVTNTQFVSTHYLTLMTQPDFFLLSRRASPSISNHLAT